MTRCPPSPDDLDREPQLAVIFALGATLDATTMALIAAHPELRDGAGETVPDSTASLARACVLVARDLRGLLETYRHALERTSRKHVPRGDEVF